MKKITKAVFPVGGMGTRFLPATKSIPKELLPIIDKPLIQYAVEEAIDAGIETLIFITSASKHAISDHFDPMPDLRAKFMAQNKSHLVDKLDTLPLEIQRVFIPQGAPLGLGHAVLQAEAMIGADEMFAVILADDFIQAEVNPLKRLVAVAEMKQSATISVEAVSDDRISSYGVIQPSEWQGDFTQVTDIIEKPDAHAAPSNYGVIGRYVLPQSVFAVLRQTKMDKNSEYQLTDALNELMRSSGLQAVKLAGQRFDCGSQSGFVMANLHVAMQNAGLKAQVLAYLSSCK
ncbi:UTP--glucose-1-phosphate uridylyltransferase [Marinicella sp. S1101]|uniref:UTP--glucose-1-phosphate uridylyltransferase n=1 Tax=Marinicella marina TaxID=2996016 RepID=UPI00226103B2|nr:UTP--glucose-1-phosphate uridylyltransferase [Marinicella marina]MCX7553507.1 UTP--glucose-1-phosphate uridylyltransferase [Marinicella marina]MDJ1140131.1 UTP--glucose-1-phosphate uridylyltransferase [Marinicella marina]